MFRLRCIIIEKEKKVVQIIKSCIAEYFNKREDSKYYIDFSLSNQYGKILKRERLLLED